MEELLIGVNNLIHLSEAGEEILIDNIVEGKEVVKTRRCHPELPLGNSIILLPFNGTNNIIRN